MSLGFDEESLEDGLLNELFSYLGQSEENTRTIATALQAPYNSGAFTPSPSYPVNMAPALFTNQKQLSLAERATDPAEGSAGSGRGMKRQRQRDAAKVKELEALAAAKMEEFALLVQRNADLKFRSNILTNAVQLRDYQLRLAKSGQAPIGSAPPPLPDTAAMTVAQVIRTPGSARLLLAPELVPPVDRDSVRSMGRLEMVSRYKALLAEASEALLAAEADPEDEAAAVRVRGVMAQFGSLMRNASVLSPDTTLQFMQTHLETGSFSAPEPGLWLNVFQYLQLTPEQVSELAAVYGLYSSIMSGILADRRALNEQLAQGLHVDPWVAAARPAVPPEQELLPSLQRNLRKEYSAHLLVRAYVFGRTLSTLQFCRSVVQSYPYVPNATGLAAAAAGVVI